MSFEQYFPLLTAAISAIALLAGYSFQKRKERQFELLKTRQDIYSRLIKNLTLRRQLSTVASADADWPKELRKEDLDSINKLIDERYPDLRRNLIEGHELFSLLCIYGSDAAVKATAQFADRHRLVGEGKVADVEIEVYLHALRLSLFPDTSVTPNDIELIDTLR